MHSLLVLFCAFYSLYTYILHISCRREKSKTQVIFQYERQKQIHSLSFKLEYLRSLVAYGWFPLHIGCLLSKDSFIRFITY